MFESEIEGLSFDDTFFDGMVDPFDCINHFFKFH